MRMAAVARALAARFVAGPGEGDQDTLPTLVAPAVRRRAMLSGAIRPQRGPTHRVQGAQRPGG